MGLRLQPVLYIAEGLHGLLQVKRLAESGGAPEDSCVVQGLVCRKNLTHRKMRKKIANPRILMLGSMFEFHRTQGRLASFDHYTKDQVCSCQQPAIIDGLSQYCLFSLHIILSRMQALFAVAPGIAAVGIGRLTGFFY